MIRSITGIKINVSIEILRQRRNLKSALKTAWPFEALISQRMTSKATILVMFQKFLEKFP